jgi:hypothetical protein
MKKNCVSRKKIVNAIVADKKSQRHGPLLPT